MIKEKTGKILVLVTDYPKKNGKVAHQFVHVRNIFYKNKGLDVTVLNFNAKENYLFKGIPVITLESYKRENVAFDILISHQPNIRQHYFFLKMYGNRFRKFILFFHGHEVLKLNKVYSKPYDYINNSLIKEKLQNAYDDFKLLIWRYYLPKVVHKTEFVFVSKWMLDEFLKWTRIPYSTIKNRCHVTYNCVAEQFERKCYDWDLMKEYDFITIRSNLDGSKYCIDFVNELAKTNPEYKFLVIGKGNYFQYNKKADNLIWQNRFLNHEEIIDMLQQAKCALMPTRTDAQGLMMCEMATFGIPVLTSDIPVCHEVFDGFDNVRLIVNDDKYAPIVKLADDMSRTKRVEKNKKYFNENTSMNEVRIICANFAPSV